MIGRHRVECRAERGDRVGAFVTRGENLAQRFLRRERIGSVRRDGAQRERFGLVEALLLKEKPGEVVECVTIRGRELDGPGVCFLRFRKVAVGS